VLAFVVTIIWLFIGAKQSADRANRSAKAANTARDQADQLVNFMLFDLRRRSNQALRREKVPNQMEKDWRRKAERIQAIQGFNSLKPFLIRLPDG
jgi:hypothetical protein